MTNYFYLGESVITTETQNQNEFTLKPPYVPLNFQERNSPAKNGFTRNAAKINGKREDSIYKWE